MPKFVLVHYQAHVNGPTACGQPIGIMTDQTHRTTCTACVTTREFQDVVFGTSTAETIGYLCNSTQVLCDACAADANVAVAADLRVVRLYRENIGRYSQHCHGCDRELVAAQPGFCELFDKRPVS